MESPTISPLPINHDYHFSSSQPRSRSRHHHCPRAHPRTADPPFRLLPAHFSIAVFFPPSLVPCLVTVCVCVCVCVCVFIKLHITTQSGPVILVILCVCVCMCVFAHNRAVRPCVAINVVSGRTVVLAGMMFDFFRFQSGLVAGGMIDYSGTRHARSCLIAARERSRAGSKQMATYQAVAQTHCSWSSSCERTSPCWW